MWNPSRRAVPLVFPAWLAVSPCAGGAQAVARTDTAAVREGMELYMRNSCYGCRGIGGGGGMGPSLRRLAERKGRTGADLFRIIELGSPGKPTAFGDRLTGAQIEKIVLYIQSRDRL